MLKEKIKNITLKEWNKILIIIGIVFLSLGAFHSNTWFDEAYSVGITRQTFANIWNFGAHDVHPVLYYWMLRIICLITNGSVIAYRIFSVIPIAIMIILGYTHIRKDFGEKTGFIFSFLCTFLPSMPIYALEVRMYSWAILTVTACAIYAYRLAKQDSVKNWIIFGISSLFSTYLHYYGLMAAGLINLFLLIHLMKNKRKKGLIFILSFGLVQLICYIPWIMCLLNQMKKVSDGFWIGFEFPKTLMELIAVQLSGYIRTESMQDLIISTIATIGLFTYIIYKIKELKKNQEDIKPFKLSVGIYFAVILVALIITIVLRTSVVYCRYLFVITGFYVFAISFVLGKEKNQAIVCTILSVVAVLGIYCNIGMIMENYSSTNNKPIEFLKANVKENDIVVYTDCGVGSVAANTCLDSQVYFLNEDDWGVQEAYKAFGPNYETLIEKEKLLDVEADRIWVIDSVYGTASEYLYGDETKYNKVMEEQFFTEYHNYKWKITLIENIK